MSKPVHAMQPVLTTNFRWGEVVMRIVVGGEEKQFVFRARSDKMQAEVRAGRVTALGEDVDHLAEDLQAFLIGIGYKPEAIEHLT